MGEQLLKADQVMEQLQISRPTLYRYVRSGELRSIKIGRSLRIPESAVEEFIETRIGGAA